MDEKRPFIATYMEASRPFGVIYTGMTNNLYRRGREHREGLIDGFSREHNCGLLVWFEVHERINSAIRREKALKHWKRSWKMQLIEQRNPAWADLYPFIIGEQRDPRIPLADDSGVLSFLAKLEAGELRDE